MKKQILSSIVPACFLLLFIILNSFGTPHSSAVGIKEDYFKVMTTGTSNPSVSYHQSLLPPDSGYLGLTFSTWPGIPRPDSVRIIIEGYGIDTIVPCCSYGARLPCGGPFIRCKADGYVSVEIENVNIYFEQTVDLEVIFIEMPYPVISVYADPNHQPNIPYISWFKMQDCHQYQYDDGTADSVFAWPEEGNMAAVRFTPDSYPAQILGAEVNIYDGTWPPGDLFAPFQMALYDDDGTNGLPGTQLAITTIAPYEWGWTYADFSSENIFITEGDFYIVKIQGGNYPNCSPVTVDMSDPDGRSYIQEISTPGEWQPVGFGDFLIRAWQKNQDIDKNTPPGDIDKSGTDGDRHLCHYDIYRLKPGDEFYYENWVLINDLVLDEFYYDTGWISQDTGYYRYAVIASYSYNQSEPAMSNVIRNALSVTINVLTECNESPEGAQVLLENDDNNPAHVYEALAPENGIVVFSDVATGYYSLWVELAYFQPYSHDNIHIANDTSLSLTLHSTCLPPTIIPDPLYPGSFRIVFAGGGAVTLYSEDFEGGIIPPGWTQEFIDSTVYWTVQTGSPSGIPDQAHSGLFNAAFGGTSATTMLITPEFDLSHVFWPKLTFWHTQAGDTVQDELKVYYKNSDATPWKPLTSFSQQNISQWTQSVVTLPNPSEHYRIGFKGEINNGGLGICLDDVEIRADTTMNVSPPCLIGFNLYLNGTHLGFMTELTYTFTDLVVGEFYVIGVSAQYPTCESMIVEYPFTYYTCDYFTPPQNFGASAEGMEVNLTWSPPASPEPGIYEIAYDDGVPENAIAWYDPGAMTAVRFTPGGYPCEIRKYHMHIFDGSWPVGNNLQSFMIHVYDDDGANGYPGTDLGSMEVTPANYEWVEFDIDSLDVSIGSGDFYLAHEQLHTYPDCPPTAVDETSAGQGRSYDRAVGASWATGQYDLYMIRATVYGPFGGDHIVKSYVLPAKPSMSPNDEAVSLRPSVNTSTNNSSGTCRYLFDDGTVRFSLIGYDIFRNDVIINESIVTDTLYTDIVSPAGIYEYNLIAVYDMGVSCPFDTSLTFECGSEFPTPEGIYADNLNNGYIFVSWDPPSEENSQKLQQTHQKNTPASLNPINNGSIKSIATFTLIGYNLWKNQELLAFVSAPDTCYYDIVTESGNYAYYVSALYYSGESWWTGPATVYINGIGSVKGKVTDALTSLPVDGAQITLYPGGYTDICSPDGQYLVFNIPHGYYMMTVEKDGYYPATSNISIPYYNINRNITLTPNSIAFLPFYENWESFSYDDQNWSFAPYQGNWIIFPEEGNPFPSAGFVCDNTVSNYSFALVSPNILLNQPDDSITLGFDLNIINNRDGARGLNKLSVEVWNNIYWITVDEIDDSTGTNWITYNYDISDYITWPSLKIRFVTSGGGWGDYVSCLIDNITVRSEYLVQLYGYITDIQGEIIPYGEITVEGYEPVMSNSSGYYSVEVASGYYNVTAEAEGYYSDTIKGIDIRYGLHFDFILEKILSVPPVMNNTTLLIYPNPATSVVYFKLPPNSEKIIVYNIQGQIIYRLDTKGQLFIQTDLSGFEKGFYIVRCILDDGKVLTKKMILE
ncbi:MAG: carboxypeptidase regulatory-like domain-containing protein [Bacteroidetes bacterium]|nr:carboxypeptidase regulatory-like domain-containing protein [Bacteroidota bacterium]